MYGNLVVLSVQHQTTVHIFLFTECTIGNVAWVQAVSGLAFDPLLIICWQLLSFGAKIIIGIPSTAGHAGII